VHSNHPVSGVSLQQAREYAAWLSKQTGETYRLPTNLEAEKLHEEAKKVASKENTLNYWAGYDITLDEVAELRQKMNELQHTLLKEAGTFKATQIGDALIYDLGGNVAEYSDDGDTYGYSAVSFVDDRGEVHEPSQAYTGFRVIKE
jgi:formylglycine-generating enzyme required for sulfatase activity